MNDRVQPPWEQKDTYALVGVTLAAFVIRLVFVLRVRPTPVSDFGWYYAHALGIVHGLGYATHGYPTAYWPPGWPYFLAGVISLFGGSVVAAEIAQAVLNALTAGLVFLIARTISGNACALAAGAVYAILPSAIEWCATLATEPLYTFLWALVTYIWLRRSTRELGWFAFSGVILGATALVRPSALLFWIIWLAYILTIPRERQCVKSVVTALAVTIFFMLLCITPMIVRNYHVFGTLVVISNNGGVSLYQGNNANSTSGDTELDNPRIQSLIDDPRTEVEGDRLASHLATQYIVAHPARVLWLSVRKVKALYTRDTGVIHWTFEQTHPPASERFISFVAMLNTTIYYAVMVFAFFGIALCAFKPGDIPRPGWRLLLAMIVYNTLIFATIFGIDRYRYPTMPFFAVFAGVGIVAALAYVRKGFVARMQTRSSEA